MLCILIHRKIQHPNIVSVLGSVVKDRRIAIISNLVRGCNLHDLLFGSETKEDVSSPHCTGIQMTCFNLITGAICCEVVYGCADSSGSCISA